MTSLLDPRPARPWRDGSLQATVALLPALLPVILLALSHALPLGAQTETGYVSLPEDDEIALARSAAPASVSDGATIWVLRSGAYEIAVPGSNGNACMVSRTRESSIEPICYDPEGARTILPIEIDLVERRIRHGDPDRAWREVHDAIDRGALLLPERPAMSYMLSAGQRLVTDDGRDVGAWKPHLMLYSPYLEPDEFGLSGPDGTLFVAYAGEPLAHLVVVVPDFVEPSGSPP